MGSVLVVDDEVDICSLLTQQLKKLGFQTSYFLTIGDALKNLSTTSYDLIFVDLNLTDGSGYDLITALRKIDEEVKVIVISAYDTERNKALANGANLFVLPEKLNHSLSLNLLSYGSYINY
jgi:DNA-binding response OmpR family regulator